MQYQAVYILTLRLKRLDFFNHSSQCHVSHQKMMEKWWKMHETGEPQVRTTGEPAPQSQPWVCQRNGQCSCQCTVEAILQWHKTATHAQHQPRGSRLVSFWGQNIGVQKDCHLNHLIWFDFGLLGRNWPKLAHSLVSSMRQNADESQLRCTVLGQKQQMSDSKIAEVWGGQGGPGVHGPHMALWRLGFAPVAPPTWILPGDGQVTGRWREGDGKVIAVIQTQRHTKDLQRTQFCEFC